MKYLEENALTWLNSVLGSYEIGDRVLCSKIEAYSCKKAGSDKKLAKNLELYYQQELEALSASKDLLSSSPLGPLTSAATRKLLINLISTMNASFPDYDFSTVKPEQFCKELDYRLAIQRINHDLAEPIDSESNGFVEKMWEAIAETIKLDECEVYSYIPDMDSDPFSDGTLYVKFFYLCCCYCVMVELYMLTIMRVTCCCVRYGWIAGGRSTTSSTTEIKRRSCTLRACPKGTSCQPCHPSCC